MAGLEINLNDIEQVVELCKNHDKYPLPLCSFTDEGEPVVVYVNDSFVKCETYQDNGWTRNHYYHTDGSIEEIYRR